MADKMTTILLVLSSFAMGFLLAIPIGAVQIEMAKRALNHKFRAAWMAGLGSVAADLMYGVIALFGVAPFLRHKTVIAAFDIVSVIILWLLAFFTFREANKHKIPDIALKSLGSKRFSFLTGFALASANPMMIFWWLVGYRFEVHTRLIEPATTTARVIFLSFCGLGIAAYLSLAAVLMYKLQTFISDTATKIIYKALGCVLAALSLFFLYSTFKNLS
jgi:threonine/homoserine/homoserine lactone efflux protein